MVGIVSKETIYGRTLLVGACEQGLGIIWEVDCLKKEPARPVLGLRKGRFSVEVGGQHRVCVIYATYCKLSVDKVQRSLTIFPDSGKKINFHLRACRLCEDQIIMFQRGQFIFSPSPDPNKCLTSQTQDPKMLSSS